MITHLFLLSIVLLTILVLIVEKIRQYVKDIRDFQLKGKK